MFVIPLPQRPHVGHYRKRAKELKAAAESAEPDALRAFLEVWLRSVIHLLGYEVEPSYRDMFDAGVAECVGIVRTEQAPTGGRLKLGQSQLLVAKLHGYASWRAFSDALRALATLDTDARRFEDAADAIVAGDEATLLELLTAHPELARARSHRQHRCTLLHYVAANGVEDFRQKAPANAVAIARMLLDAGAEVDALAETYGGGRAQTTMNLLVSSVHPHDAGLQGALAELLLDRGAALEGLDDDGSPLQTALAFGYVDTAEVLARRGARIGNITAAAALGRLDLVREFETGRGPGAKESLVRLYWSGVPRRPEDRRLVAFHWSCKFGRLEVVEHFLGAGLDPAHADADGMTPLHHACSRPHLDVARLLLARGVPLEVKNRWGGTVLDSTLYFACGARRDPRRLALFAECIALLIASGASLAPIDYTTGVPELDEVLARHRPRPAGA